MHVRSALIFTGLAAVLTATVVAATKFVEGPVPGTFLGPSTGDAPYVRPTAAGWEVTSLLSVGESAGETLYSMVGIPDGLGAIAGRWEDGPGKYVADKAYMTVFMNHELGGTAGGVRLHGQKGAFVSQWSIHLNSLQVKWGEDLIQNVRLWDGLNNQYVDAIGLPGSVFGRFCSADLPAPAAFFNRATGKGFNGRLYMNGEESGNEGRAFAHVVTGSEKGTAYQLPALGRMSYENSLAHPDTGDSTLVVNLDDSTPGQVYVYVGSKKSAGNPVERAGLTGGSLYGIRVTAAAGAYGNAAAPFEDKGAINGTFGLVSVTDLAHGTGGLLQTTSRTRGITEFARPEDGAWDTQVPNTFYFVTTGASVNGASQTARLYKLTFNSVTNPTGGTIQLVVDAASLTGTDGQTARSFDNMAVDGDGAVLIQEDPGSSSYIAKTWRVNPSAPLAAVQILESDRTRFISGLPGFLTQDEESSGIIEVTDLVQNANWSEEGRRYFLAVMQAHYPLPTPLVEGGNFYLIASPK